MVVGCARPRHAATERAAATAAGAAALVSEEAEELLQLLFSVQGTFTDAQAAAVAAQEGCSAETALTFFQGLQTAAARCLQRARERASEAAAAAAAAADGSGGINGSRTNGSGVNGGGSAGTAAVGLAAAAAARQAGGSKLKRLINDPGDGGLRDASVTGPFVSLMTSLSSSVVRCRAAAAVAASRRNIRGKLVTTAGFLTTLEEWLEAAQQALQYTLLRQVLLALAALPLEAALLRSAGCATLLRAVRRLQKHPHERVAAAAVALYAEWQQVLQARGGGGGGLAPAADEDEEPAEGQPQQAQQRQPPSKLQPADVQQAGRPAAALRHTVPPLQALGRKGSSGSAQAAAAPAASGPQQAAMRGYQSLVAAGGDTARTAHVQRPLSADDIRREQQRKQQQAQLQQLRAKEQGAASAPAPALAPGSKQPPAEVTAAEAAPQAPAPPAAKQQQYEKLQQQQQPTAPPAAAASAAARKRQRSDRDDGGEQVEQQRSGGLAPAGAQQQPAVKQQQPAAGQVSQPPARRSRLEHAAPAAASRVPPGSPKQQQEQQQQQAAWPVVPHVLPGIVPPKMKHPVAFGEDSVEAQVRARARARQDAAPNRSDAAEPLIDSSSRGQKEPPPPELPYLPVDPEEAADEERRLEAGGWRPPSA